MKRVLAIFLSLLLMLPLSVLPTLVATADIEGRVVRDINLKGNVSKTIKSDGYVCALSTTFPATDLSGYNYADLAVEFDMYVEGDVNALKNGMDAVLEVTSSGAADKNEINWNLSGIQWQADKWFRTTLKFSSSSKGSTDTIDLTKTNYIRLYMYTNGGKNKAYVVKCCNFRIVDLSKGAVGTDMIGDGTFKVTPPEWKLIETQYETTEAIIAGYNLGDYMQPNTGADATPALQTLLDAMGNNGGGTVFVPAGRWTFKGTLEIPYGVVLQGDWRAPTDEQPEAVGTIFEVYSGKGNTNGNAFITELPNSCVQGITFWYPEQDPENIVPYPITVQQYKEGNWGADYTHVRNCTFINAYRAVQQGPGGSGCPNVYNVYGTPLYIGLKMDNIADIGRFDYVYFAAKYWENCGLPGAPTTDAAKEALAEHLFNNATGMISGRVDWSYWSFADIDGYKVALQFKESDADPGAYANGHVYGMNFTNCGIGVRLDGIGGAGELFANITMTNCTYGIYTTTANQQDIGNVQMNHITIDADTAIEHTGSMRIFMNDFNILRGGVVVSGGPVTISGSTFATAAPQVTMKNGASNAIFQDNKATDGNFAVDNQCMCQIEYSADPVVMDEIDWMTSDQSKDEVVKAAREVLYVADLDKTGKTDVTAKLQTLLTKAGDEGGGYVFLPGGFYLLKGSVTVPSGVELCGATDVGRNPYRIGTIFEVCGRQTDATIILSENSGLRAVVFDYPEQGNTDTTLKTYPYAVQGRGENVYLVNVAIRNGFDGVDLMTYKCDNHYVKYLAGYCFHSVLKVGGGSVGGKVINYQMNSSAWWNGDESKYGSWPNCPTAEEKADPTETTPGGGAYRLRNIYGQTNCISLTVGHVTDQVLYNNFTYLGAAGAYFVAEDGKAASGWNVGNAYDYTRVGIKVDAIDDMDFINVQIVSYNYTGEVPDTHQVYLTDKCEDTVNILNLACWAQPDSFLRVDNGTLNVYCADYTDNAKTSNLAILGENGKLNLQNGTVTNGGVNSLAAANLKNLKMTGYINEHALKGSDACDWGTNMVRVTRWDVPQNATIDKTQKLFFTEAFTDYKTETVNEIENVLSKDGTFSTLSAINQNGNITLVKDGDNAMMRVYHNKAAQTAYARNATLRMKSGHTNDLYMLETRLNVKTLRDNEYAQVMIAVYNMTATSIGSVTPLVFFQPDGVYVNEEKIADYTADTWYRVQVDFDLTKTSNKTYTVTLLDDEYNVIATSAEIAFDANYQGNANDVGALNITAMADPDANGTRDTELLVDYVFVTQDPSAPEATTLLGDVDGNGKINTTDARKILQFAAGVIQANELDTAAADVDQNGKVNTTDARKVLQYAAGIITTF